MTRDGAYIPQPVITAFVVIVVLLGRSIGRVLGRSAGSTSRIGCWRFTSVPALDEDAGHLARRVRFDLVEQLHGLDQADHRAGRRSRRPPARTAARPGDGAAYQTPVSGAVTKRMARRRLAIRAELLGRGCGRRRRRRGGRRGGARRPARGRARRTTSSPGLDLELVEARSPRSRAPAGRWRARTGSTWALIGAQRHVPLGRSASRCARRSRSELLMATSTVTCRATFGT